MRTITTAALGGLAISLLTAPPAWADTFQVNTIADRVDANIGDGVCTDARGRCSLRAAVQEANSNPDADTITLGAVRCRLTLAGAGEDAAASGDLDVTWTITITGAGSTVDVTGNDRVFDVLGSNLRESGGGFRSTGTLSISDSIVAGNGVVGTGASGGGAFNSGGTLTVEDSTFDSNTATRAGGAIEANAGTTAVRRSTLSNNSTGSEPGNGGGLHLTDTGTVSVSNSRVVANTANAEGGGL